MADNDNTRSLSRKDGAPIPQARSVRVFLCANPQCLRPHVVLSDIDGEPIAHFVVPDPRPGEGFIHELSVAMEQSAFARFTEPKGNA